MKATLVRIAIWLVTAAAIVMMFWPLVRQFIGRVIEPPIATF